MKLFLNHRIAGSATRFAGIPRFYWRVRGFSLGLIFAIEDRMDTAELDRISYLTIQSAIEIHKTLGPGVLENVYRPCMIYELRARKLEVTSEVKVPVRYKDLVLDGFYRLDLLINDAVDRRIESRRNRASGAPRTGPLVFAIDGQAGWACSSIFM